MGVVVCLALGVVLHFGFGIGTSDSASIVQVLLTIVAILIAARAALYALESARAAKDAVAPLEQLASREEGVVRALAPSSRRSRLRHGDNRFVTNSTLCSGCSGQSRRWRSPRKAEPLRGSQAPTSPRPWPTLTPSCVLPIVRGR
jgi:hypothetical protein